MTSTSPLETRKRLLVAGIMSGTSCDGITTAIVRVARRAGERRLSARFVSLRDERYPRRLRETLLAAGDLDVPALASLHRTLGGRLAAALERHLATMERDEPRRPLDLIGSHGHTLFHRSRGTRGNGPSVSWQIGEAAEIAASHGCPVVSDFRPADIAAGGEGAPLVPFGDAVLFGRSTRGGTRVCLNIGGIANITVLDGQGTAVLAFDTGPGVALIDAAVRRTTGGRKTMDRGGALARQGTVDRTLLGRMIAEPYFRRSPPKSTGRELFGPGLLDRCARGRHARAPDLLATLTELTVESIARAIEGLPQIPDDVVVAGGGTKNSFLMERLRTRLTPITVRASDELGWPIESREAAAFAILAAAFVWRIPASRVETTGAERPAVLGKLALPPA